LTYKHVTKGIFIERPNRFIAMCEVAGEVKTVHVKNTGRCKELLIPGAPVYLEMPSNPLRKTQYSLIGVEKGEMLVNIDSSAPNKVVGEALLQGLRLPGMGPLKLVKPEVTFGSSRFDFYLEDGTHKAFMEVKGVTLEEDGIALFPDAPTLRGLKHMEELVIARKEGYLAYVLFVIQMKPVTCFRPNNVTQPEFGAALKKAKKHGVHILAYDCTVEPDGLALSESVIVRL